MLSSSSLLCQMFQPFVSLGSLTIVILVYSFNGCQRIDCVVSHHFSLISFNKFLFSFNKIFVIVNWTVLLIMQFHFVLCIRSILNYCNVIIIYWIDFIVIWKCADWINFCRHRFCKPRTEFHPSTYGSHWQCHTPREVMGRIWMEVWFEEESRIWNFA